MTVQFGVQPLQAFRALMALPRFIRNLLTFKKHYDGVIELMPCLHDRRAQAGDAQSEYFLQDLNVARRIFERNPNRHVDVGSRVDGFVAHVAAFRTIEVIDIRPMSSDINGIIFKQTDLMNPDAAPRAYCDSLSCLHALEHFGLGRYGDRVDVLGWQSGLASLSHLVSSGGHLYLSTPIGTERVVFDAHRIFSPTKLIETARHLNLNLIHLSWIAHGRLTNSANMEEDAVLLGRQDYSLGIFEFVKN